MTQDEKWQERWQVAMDFIGTNRRNPSKFVGAEREIRNWLKHQRKLLNAGDLRPERVERLRTLLALCERYRHKNQYQ